MKKALILVDFENEWLDEKSEYYVGDISDVLDRTNKLIDFCRKQNQKIIFVRHVEKDSEGEFAENSENTKIILSLHKNDSDLVITKYKISPFYKTELDKELKGVKQIVVAGILANLCVRSTIQDAYDRGFDVDVIKDCCVSFSKETQDFTFRDLKETREEISFINLNEFIK